MNVGQTIAQARFEKGLTLRALADKCGVHNAAISQIETGHIKNAAFTTVVAIADALEIPIEQLANAVREDKGWK